MRSKIKKLIYILPLIYALNSYSQIITKENFVNEMYHTIVDSSFRYYYLHANAPAIYWHYEKNELMAKLAVYDSAKNPAKSELLESLALYDSTIKQISGSILEELYDKANADTITEHWDYTQLNKARKISLDIKNKMKLRDKHLLLEEEKNIFFFSKPIFNKSKEYAIISMERYCGNICAYRCIYLLRKITGKWKDVAHFECSIS